MYGFSPRPLIPNDMQWNHQQAPFNYQMRPFYAQRAPFRPRNQGFQNHRLPMQEGSLEHWCETCDRGFPTEHLLNNHKQQHQKCNIDGCQFIAHPKVITKHIQMQHSSGLYKKISKLNNPEDIEKWREERRKKYPTKTNIDKKAAELKEKIERGEKMGLGRREWGNKRADYKQNRDSNSGQGLKRSNYYNNQPESSFRKPAKKPKILPAPEENRSLVPFSGIQCLEMGSDEEVDQTLSCNDFIEDDAIESFEGITIEKDKANIEKPVVCGALSSLICEYGSSDDENDNAKEKQNINMANPLEKNKHIDTEKDLILKNLNFVNKIDKDLMKYSVSKSNAIKSVQTLNGRCKMTNSNDLEKEKKSLVSEIDTKNITVNSTDEGNDNGKEVNKLIHKNECKSDGNRTNELSMIKENVDSSDKNSNDDVDSGPEEIKVEKNPEAANVIVNNTAITSKNVKKRVEIVKKKHIYMKPKPKVPSTLIYKLLSKEMKQERNKVLQCIRYIRTKHYFDKNN